MSAPERDIQSNESPGDAASPEQDTPVKPSSPVSLRQKWIVGIVTFLVLVVPLGFWKYHVFYHHPVSGLTSGVSAPVDSSSSASNPTINSSSAFQSDKTAIIQWSSEQRSAYQTVLIDAKAVEQNGPSSCTQFEEDLASYQGGYGATSATAPSSFYSQLLTASNAIGIEPNAAHLDGPSDPSDQCLDGGLSTSSGWQTYTTTMQAIFSEAKSVGGQPE